MLSSMALIRFQSAESTSLAWYIALGNHTDVQDIPTHSGNQNTEEKADIAVPTPAVDPPVSFHVFLAVQWSLKCFLAIGTHVGTEVVMYAHVSP